MHFLVEKKIELLHAATPPPPAPTPTPCNLHPRGTPKKNDGPPRGWLVPRRPKNYQGWSDFFPDFFIAFFFYSPHWETPKNVMKTNREIIGFGFFVDFFVKSFPHDLFAKRFL
jgi:hypothetical protein